MTESVRYLARFRADPSKVRVSVIRCEQDDGRRKTWWYATISTRPGVPYRGVGAPGVTAEEALWEALLVADCERIPGIDLGMDSAYEHPMGPLASPERAVRVRDR